jgi:predicted nucleic acid-binding protein
MNRAGVLLDAGPLVALLNHTDTQHQRAKALAAACEPPLRTCEAVLAEAAHLLSKVNPMAPGGVVALGRLGAFAVAMRIEEHWDALERTLDKSADVPASLADACLIRCAELYEEPRILTFDTDFLVYRWSRNRRFDVLG